MMQQPFASPLGATLQVVKDALAPDSPLRGAVIALGNFDGFHIGHQALLSAARSVTEMRRPLAIMSVEPHPRQILSADPSPFRLALRRQKHEAAASLRVDYVFEPSFDSVFRNCSPELFVERTLWRDLGVEHVIVGSDFRFGANRSGTISTLRDFGERLGIRVSVAPLVDRVSSTAVRACLKRGDVAGAADMLGRPWEAEIIRVDGRNYISPDQIRPQAGSYRVQAPTGALSVVIKLSEAGEVIAAPPCSNRLRFLDACCGG